MDVYQSNPKALTTGPNQESMKTTKTDQKRKPKSSLDLTKTSTCSSLGYNENGSDDYSSDRYNQAFSESELANLEMAYFNTSAKLEKSPHSSNIETQLLCF